MVYILKFFDIIENGDEKEIRIKIKDMMMKEIEDALINILINCFY